MVRQRRRLRAVANERTRRERKKCSECSASVRPEESGRGRPNGGTRAVARVRVWCRENETRCGSERVSLRAGVLMRARMTPSRGFRGPREPRRATRAGFTARRASSQTSVEARICRDARGFLTSRRKMRSFVGAERAGVRSRGGVAHERDALPSRLTHLRTRAKSGSGESDEPALAVSKCLDGGTFPSEKSLLRAVLRTITTEIIDETFD